MNTELLFIDILVQLKPKQYSSFIQFVPLFLIMKFKCKMNDVGAMRDFTNVANTIARMSKQCVIQLNKDAVCFNVADDTTPMVWSRLDREHFFTDYLIVGKSEQFNEIYMETNSAMLSKSVTTLKTAAKSCKIKLTNKQQPCLTFEIELNSINTELRLCVHDVPVTIIPQKKWKEYHEPSIQRYDISLEMPQFRHLKSVIERVKNMSPIVEISADTNGLLAIKAESDTATITVNFPNLIVHECSGNDQTISASVDIKKFHAFLAWDVVHPTTMKCNILSNKVININLSLENHLQIRYYIPAVEPM